MATTQKEDLNALFVPLGSGLEPDILGVFESILRLYSITPQELFYKWESYCLKMGSEETVLDLNTVRMFYKDVQDGLENLQQNKIHERRPVVGATPRATHTSGNMFGMLDELTPNALQRRTGSVKRKGDFQTPASKKTTRPDNNRPEGDDNSKTARFSERLNAGQILESINGHLPSVEIPTAPFPEARVKPVANTDVKKFGYKPMSMRLTESSEVLDERIDDFMALVQKHHKLEDGAFGNAAAQSTSEIVAVGRIASDTPEGKLNAASLVLEMSRRMGAGLRVTLKVDAVPQYSFFPGQIVAVRGTNASGLYFQVSEVLSVPSLPMPVSLPTTIDAFNDRLGLEEGSDGMPLNILFGSGPYTTDDNLDFEPLHALCQKAEENMVDAMVLTGPFLDIEHPLLASGDFDLPDVKGLAEEANMTNLFRLWITPPLERLCIAVPSVTIILVPSVRDTISKHVSWPQEQIVKRELGLPKQVKMVPNPCFVSLNETLIAVSSQDILYELSREHLSHGSNAELLARLPKHIIEQRHFYPLFPPMSRDRYPNGAVKATGPALDVGYWKLGEWPNVRPDILILPSILTPSVKVVDNVVVINPGSLSKRKAAGTFSQMSLQPRTMSESERHEPNLLHNVFERARVEIVRI